jgi:pullulanase/glycogen debranching enzyme
MTAPVESLAPALPGSPFPLGATPVEDGTNFAVASGVADRMVLCLFDTAGVEDVDDEAQKSLGRSIAHRDPLADRCRDHAIASCSTDVSAWRPC